jgi:Ca2+-binding RTX toxin-like protein
MTVEWFGGSSRGLSRSTLGIMLLVVLTLTMTAGVAFPSPQPAANSLTIADDHGPDRIVGGPRFDEIFGYLGDDRVRAGAGPDFVDGGRGDDVLRFGSGDRGDHGTAGPGNDIIFGGPGPDFISDQSGRDRGHGGLGGDFFRVSTGVDHMYGGPGGDGFMSLGDGQRDRIACGRGRDTASWDNRREMLLDRTSGCETQGIGIPKSELLPPRRVPRVVAAGL